MSLALLCFWQLHLRNTVILDYKWEIWFDIPGHREACDRPARCLGCWKMLWVLPMMRSVTSILPWHTLLSQARLLLCSLGFSSFRQFVLSKVGAEVLLSLTRLRTSYACLKAPVFCLSCWTICLRSYESSWSGDQWPVRRFWSPSASVLPSRAICITFLRTYSFLLSSLVSGDRECHLEPEKVRIFPTLVNFVSFSYCCHCSMCQGTFLCYTFWWVLFESLAPSCLWIECSYWPHSKGKEFRLSCLVSAFANFFQHNVPLETFQCLPIQC